MPHEEATGPRRGPPRSRTALRAGPAGKRPPTVSRKPPGRSIAACSPSGDSASPSSRRPRCGSQSRRVAPGISHGRSSSCCPVRPPCRLIDNQRLVGRRQPHAVDPLPVVAGDPLTPEFVLVHIAGHAVHERHAPEDTIIGGVAHGLFPILIVLSLRLDHDRLHRRQRPVSCLPDDEHGLLRPVSELDDLHGGQLLAQHLRQRLELRPLLVRKHAGKGVQRRLLRRRAGPSDRSLRTAGIWGIK